MSALPSPAWWKRPISVTPLGFILIGVTLGLTTGLIEMAFWQRDASFARVFGWGAFFGLTGYLFWIGNDKERGRRFLMLHGAVMLGSILFLGCCPWNLPLGGGVFSLVILGGVAALSLYVACLLWGVCHAIRSLAATPWLKAKSDSHKTI
jgi:hypothetical protein